jgi:hypothetical protein
MPLIPQRGFEMHRTNTSVSVSNRPMSNNLNGSFRDG